MLWAALVAAAQPGKAGAAGVYSWWRLQIAAENSPQEADVNEIALYEGNRSVIDLRRIGFFFCDTEATGHFGWSAFDADLATYWETRPEDDKVNKSFAFKIWPPTWITALYVYGRPSDANRTIPQFRVQYAPDGWDPWAGQNYTWNTSWTASGLGSGWHWADEAGNTGTSPPLAATTSTTTLPPWSAPPFWRLQIAAESSDQEAYVYEIDLYDYIGQRILKFSSWGADWGDSVISHIVSDTSLDGNLAANAFDRNTTTYWEIESGSGKVGKSVWFEIWPATWIESINVYSGDVDYRSTIPAFHVQYSRDGSSWNTYWTASGLGPGSTRASRRSSDWSSPAQTGGGGGGGTQTLSGPAILGIAIGGRVALVSVLCAIWYFKIRPKYRVDPPITVAAGTRVGVVVPTGTVALGHAEEDEEAPPSEPERPPAYWESPLRGATFSEQLEPPGEVSDAVAALVESTWVRKKTRDRAGAPVPEGIKVSEVRRLEDSDLWARYSARRRQIRDRRRVCATVEQVSGSAPLRTAAHIAPLRASLEGRINEVYLLHGTTSAGAKGITAEGFQLTLAGTHKGSMFGKGIYLAECSSKADEYATDEEHDGFYHMLLCRVVLGQPLQLTRGGESMFQIIADALSSGLCDSVLGDREAAVGTYREFVVYNSDQVYPEYLVRYRRRAVGS